MASVGYMGCWLEGFHDLAEREGSSALRQGCVGFTHARPDVERHIALVVSSRKRRNHVADGGPPSASRRSCLGDWAFALVVFALADRWPRSATWDADSRGSMT